ncbi:hypothetical protein [Capnocytophaga canis]|uniref:hypothetical protein n=1 Tax=Capnocytophaga canis TaxID=1848903 RepID=UPI0015629F53|nr:hypothetical protein [Capnocytophaga canis]
MKKIKVLSLLLVIGITHQLYSQDAESKNFISFKKGVLNTLLLEDGDSSIFDQSKPTSHLFNETYSDYNISYQRKISSRFLLGVDFYGFNAFNKINPYSLSLQRIGLVRKDFSSHTDVKLFRGSIFYSLLDREYFKIRAGMYIPLYEIKNQSITAAYERENKREEVVYIIDNKKTSGIFLGIVQPEIAVDFLYCFNNIETGIATSWNSNISSNEPIIRFSVVLNVKF